MQTTQPMRSFEHDCGELIPDVVNAFGLHRLDMLATTMRPSSADRQATFKAFMERNLMRYPLYEQDGVAHLWTLTRSDDGRWQLNAESNDHRFPAELYDLSEAEAWDYMAEPLRSEGRERSAIVIEDGFEHQPKAAAPIDHHTYTPRMLADRWECKASQVRQLIRAGKLDAFRAGPRLLMVRGEVVQTYERSRLPEVVTAEMQAERDAVKRQRQATMNEGRLKRRTERRTKGMEFDSEGEASPNLLSQSGLISGTNMESVRSGRR